jgi:hypothetical protein
VCIVHAGIIANQFNFSLPTFFDEKTKPDERVFVARHYVYYLMTGPSTVKIGTTRCLPKRMQSLRTDIQYVVAIEPGGQTLERRRHAEFAAERINPRREDFTLSENLKTHIDRLLPDRDQLVAEAMTPPFGYWAETAKSEVVIADC